MIKFHRSLSLATSNIYINRGDYIPSESSSSIKTTRTWFSSSAVFGSLYVDTLTIPATSGDTIAIPDVTIAVPADTSDQPAPSGPGEGILGLGPPQQSFAIEAKAETLIGGLHKKGLDVHTISPSNGNWELTLGGIPPGVKDVHYFASNAYRWSADVSFSTLGQRRATFAVGSQYIVLDPIDAKNVFSSLGLEFREDGPAKRIIADVPCPGNAKSDLSFNFGSFVVSLKGSQATIEDSSSRLPGGSISAVVGIAKEEEHGEIELGDPFLEAVHLVLSYQGAQPKVGLARV